MAPNLIEAWLRDFGSDRILLRETGFGSQSYWRILGTPRLTAWRHANERYSLFDITEGPRSVARAMFVHGPDDVATVADHRLAWMIPCAPMAASSARLCPKPSRPCQRCCVARRRR